MKAILTRKIDPLNKSRYPSGMTLQICGFIPGWIQDSYFGALEDGAKGAFERVLEHYYGHFMPSASMTGTVTKDGVYKYPEDPDLYPLVSFEGEAETLYQYDFGIVAIVDNESREVVFCKRID
jgi:hypothetical protein